MSQNRVRLISGQVLRAVVVVFFSLAAASLTAKAQTTLGGHIGCVLPLVTRSDGQTTTLSDNFSVGFPVGITVKGTGKMAFDLEFVSSVQDSPRDVSLTVHPGLLYGVGHGFTIGGRAAFVVDSAEYGFTPLLNKGWPIKSKGSFFKAYFVEADLPVRFDRPVGGPNTNPVTFAMHFGLGF
ncbi:MAG: hypothetical protein ABSE51_21585 [Terracidiphilus sp.]